MSCGLRAIKVQTVGKVRCGDGGSGGVRWSEG